MRKVSSLQISTGGQQWWRRGSKWEGATCGGGGGAPSGAAYGREAAKRWQELKSTWGHPGRSPSHTPTACTIAPLLPPPPGLQAGTGGAGGRCGRITPACLAERNRVYFGKKSRGKEEENLLLPKHSALVSRAGGGRGGARGGWARLAAPPPLCFALLCFAFRSNIYLPFCCHVTGG